MIKSALEELINRSELKRRVTAIQNLSTYQFSLKMNLP